MRQKFARFTALLRRWLDRSSGRPRQLVLPSPLHVAPLRAADATTAAIAETPGPVLAKTPLTNVDRRRLASAFDASHPVRTRTELFGRDREVASLMSATLEFQQHTVVHGARGSGKTSLVRVFGDFADQAGVVVIYIACEPDASFADIIRPYLHALPAAALLDGGRSGFHNAVAALPANFTPRDLVELVADAVTAPTVFILDEFDRIEDPAVRSDIAAAMKLLSDALSPILFILVGIARSVSDVIAGHPSLRRHMHAVALGRIESDGVATLIDAGERTACLSFAPDARALVARAACGSPYHVRTFCHHAALAALRRAAERVEGSDVVAGLASAYERWSQMSEPTATLFTTLVDEGRDLESLENVAHEAALRDGLSRNHERWDATAQAAFDRLAPALVDDGAGDVLFQDSVAPQYLIASIIVGQDARTRQLLLREAPHALSR